MILELYTIISNILVLKKEYLKKSLYRALFQEINIELKMTTTIRLSLEFDANI